VRRFWILLPSISLLLAPDRPDRPPTAQPADAPPVTAGGPSAALPTAAEMERLAKKDPVAFMEACLRRYRLHVVQRPDIAASVVGVGQALPGQAWAASAALLAGSFEVTGYRMIMQKQEAIDGKLAPLEIVEVFFRERPHSVALCWLEGARRAERALYVQGENNDKLLVRPKGALARRIVGDVLPIDPEGTEARSAGRYSVKEYGLRKAAERALAFCKSDLARGMVRVEYRGIHKIKDAGNRPCYVLHFDYAKPQRDDCMELILYFDTETWLQVGSVLKRADGSLVGAYYFRDIRLNPEFSRQQFQPAFLK
jgi:hypothetical protein